VSLSKKIVFALVALVVALVLLEGLTGVLWMLSDYTVLRRSLPRAVEFKEEHHARHDEEIGWINVPGRSLADFYAPGAGVTINAQGFRALEDYAKGPGDRFRLICLGDSFTHGYGVDDRETWPALLEQSNPAVQAVNMGQGGYSIGQDWLWFKRDAMTLDPRGVVLAVIADDFWRMAGERMINGYGKPTFNLVDGEIRVGNQPVPPKIETGRALDSGARTITFFKEHSRLVRTFASLFGSSKESGPETERDEQLRIGLAMIDEIHAGLAARDIPFAIVVLPEVRDLTDPVQQGDYRMFSGVMQGYGRERGIPTHNLAPAFVEAAAGRYETLFLQEHWNHYSAEGNRLVAVHVDRFLRSAFPDYPD